MERNIKWDTKSLVELLNKSTSTELIELYKALLAYSIGLQDISADIDKTLTDLIENDFYRDDSFTSFVNEGLVEKAWNRLGYKVLEEGEE